MEETWQEMSKFHRGAKTRVEGSKQKAKPDKNWFLPRAWSVKNSEIQNNLFMPHAFWRKFSQNVRCKVSRQCLNPKVKPTMAGHLLVTYKLSTGWLLRQGEATVQGADSGGRKWLQTSQHPQSCIGLLLSLYPEGGTVSRALFLLTPRGIIKCIMATSWLNLPFIPMGTWSNLHHLPHNSHVRLVRLRVWDWLVTRQISMEIGELNFGLPDPNSQL